MPQDPQSVAAFTPTRNPGTSAVALCTQLRGAVALEGRGAADATVLKARKTRLDQEEKTATRFMTSPIVLLTCTIQYRPNKRIKAIPDFQASKVESPAGAVGQGSSCCRRLSPVPEGARPGSPGGNHPGPACHPLRPKKSPAPRVHAANKRARQEFLEAYRLFMERRPRDLEEKRGANDARAAWFDGNLVAWLELTRTETGEPVLLLVLRAASLPLHVLHLSGCRTSTSCSPCPESIGLFVRDEARALTRASSSRSINLICRNTKGKLALSR
jgi:ferredoxin